MKMLSKFEETGVNYHEIIAKVTNWIAGICRSNNDNSAWLFCSDNSPLGRYYPITILITHDTIRSYSTNKILLWDYNKANPTDFYLHRENGIIDDLNVIPFIDKLFVDKAKNANNVYTYNRKPNQTLENFIYHYFAAFTDLVSIWEYVNGKLSNNIFCCKTCEDINCFDCLHDDDNDSYVPDEEFSIDCNNDDVVPLNLYLISQE